MEFCLQAQKSKSRSIHQALWFYVLTFNPSDSLSDPQIPITTAIIKNKSSNYSSQVYLLK